MIRKSEDRKIDIKSNLFEGNGEIKVCHLLNGSDEMYGKGRVFAHTTLQPGCSIGYHVHENESETYYIYSGTAEFNDNGTITTVNAGDVTFTPAGEGHGIKNIGSDPLNIIAMILFK